MSNAIRAAAFLCSALLVAACSDPFLRSVELRRPPNDGTGCAPEAVATDVTVTVGIDTITIAWSIDGTDADGVRIERREDGGTWGPIGDALIEATSHPDTSVRPDTAYAYQVTTYRRAANETCYGTASAQVAADTLPAAPQFLEAITTSATSVTLLWKDTNALESGYRIERQSEGEGYLPTADVLDGTYVYGQPATGDTSPRVLYVDDTLVAGRTYDFRIAGFNANGTGPYAATTQRAARDPVLDWTDPPYLENDCRLVIPGDVAFDAIADPASATYTGTADLGSPAPMATANATGVQAPLVQLSTTTFPTSWTANDDRGGTATINRDLAMNVSTTTRQVDRRGTRSPGDDAAPGSQALRPGCSACSGRQGKVSAGGRSTCAISDAGEARCWGFNRSDQAVGDFRGVLPVPDPACADSECTAPLVGVDLAVEHFGGKPHACTRTAAGEVLCWGFNYYGEVGNGTTETAGAPTPVCVSGSGASCQPLTDVREVALTATSTCARLGSGRVRCWGDHYESQLGDGTSVDSSLVPTMVCVSGTWDGTSCSGGAPLENVTSIAAGYEHTCAITTSAEVMCWGSNWNNALGDGTGNDRATAVAVCASGAWDTSSDDCLDGGTPSRLSGVAAISAGEEHTCALMAGDGSVKCWGYGGSGQLGNGLSSGWYSNPLDVCVTGEWDSSNDRCWNGVTEDTLIDVLEISAGSRHTCALTSAYEVLCWGEEEFGMLGNGIDSRFTYQVNPAPVCSSGSGTSCVPLTGIERIDANTDATCAVIQGSGEVLCWGFNEGGQLGTGDVTHAVNPVATCRSGTGASCQAMNGVAFTRGGPNITCALMSGSGEVWCWGTNEYGGLGRGVAEIQPFGYPACETGVGVSCTPLSDMQSLAVGSFNACAVGNDARAYCWGFNAHGELGNGTGGFTTSQRGPTVVCAQGSGATCTPLDGVTSLALGGRLLDFPSEDPFDCFSTGSLTGDNCMDGIPMYGHSCAVLADGTTKCWGDNRRGQLGTGIISPSGGACGTDDDCNVADLCVCEGSAAPPCSPFGSGYCQRDSWLDCTNNSDCSTGFAFCDGGNCMPTGTGGFCSSTPCPTGEECLTDALGREVCSRGHERFINPVTVACGAGFTGDCNAGDPLADVNSVVAGAVHTCALRDDGSVRCWGGNDKAQLGPGSISDEALPIAVPLSNVLALAAGANHTCALLVDSTIKCWGANTAGQLGDGTAGSPKSLPATVCVAGQGVGCTPLSAVVAIAAGANFSCAVLEDGSGRCWGGNSFGQLGSTTNISTFDGTQSICAHDPAVTCDGTDTCSGPLADIVALDAGDHHACALLADGSVVCWGSNSHYQHGDTSTQPQSCAPTFGTCPAGMRGCDAADRVENFAVRSCDVATVSIP